MKKQNIIALLVLVCALGFALSLSQAQANRAFGTRTAVHNATGALRFVGANPASPIVVPGADVQGLTATDRAAAILDVYGPQFGVANPRQDLRLTSSKTAASRVVNRYQQYYNGVPVLGGQLVVNMTANGGLLSIGGEASPNLTIGTTAVVDAVAAQQTALNWAARRFGVSAAELVVTPAQLFVYDARLLGPEKHPVQLVWNVEVKAVNLRPIRALVLVNAINGGVSLGFNQVDDRDLSARSGAAVLGLPGTQNALGSAAGVETRAPGTADLETYDANNGSTLPGTFLCDETQQPCTNGAIPDADAAHAFAKDSYDFFWEQFGRDSLDDAGLQLISTVRLSDGGSPFCNAFWNGEQMAYGNDCGLVVDDVVGHELTHGVTDYTNSLFYYYQSGAINESLSDVFGEFIDLTNGAGDDSAGVKWHLGEDSGIGALRFMDNPPEDGLSPDRMHSPNYWMEEAISPNWDNGGVHINSGINNKATYLLTDGDTFNGITVTGIGLEKVAAIYYDTQVNKLTSGSDYNDMYEYLYQSCLDLVGTGGITAADCDQVTNATQAVEMHLLPLNDWMAPEAEVCPGGQSAQVIFGEDFEAGDSSVTTTVISGSDNWYTMEELAAFGVNYSHSGVRAWYGENVASVNDSALAMVDSVSIPAGAYLHFAHAFWFEWDPSGDYDGGIVEYSTNGTTWTQLTSATSGQPYNGTIASGEGNPLAGKTAFVYDSHGYGSTRFDLSALSGQNVRFRWRIGTDSVFGAYGWFLDDIYVYTCGQAGPTNTPGPTPTDLPGGATELVDNGGFEAGVAPWVIKNATGDNVKCNKPGKPPVANNGTCAFRFKGGVGEAGAVQQVLDFTGVVMAAGDTIDLLYAMNVSTTSVGKIKLVVKYSDTLDKTKIAGSPVLTTGYEFWGNDQPLISGNVSKIKFGASNRSTSGKWYIDDVSVLHIPASSGTIALPGGSSKVEAAPKAAR
jgi:bacillolysin